MGKRTVFCFAVMAGLLAGLCAGFLSMRWLSEERIGDKRLEYSRISYLLPYRFEKPDHYTICYPKSWKTWNGAFFPGTFEESGFLIITPERSRYADEEECVAKQIVDAVVKDQGWVTYGEYTYRRYSVSRYLGLTPRVGEIFCMSDKNSFYLLYFWNSEEAYKKEMPPVIKKVLSSIQIRRIEYEKTL